MRYPKTDSQLRGDIIRAGRLADIVGLESLVSRDSLADRAEYRRGLEDIASTCGVERTEQIPSTARAGVLPYGPTA